MNDVVKQASTTAIATDLSVHMDDVVSAFVAKYEDNLFARKKEVAAEIRILERQLSDLDKQVLKDTAPEHPTQIDFGLKVEETGRGIEWAKERVCTQLAIYDPDENQTHYSGRSRLTVRTYQEITPAHLAKHNGLTDQKRELDDKLSVTLADLKSLPRKERQVRGRIAMKKLEDAGYESLMADPEMAALVQLD
jgi:hypothetical protein